MMLHTKYQSLWFQTKFFMLTYVKHVTPGAGHFWPQGRNLNKLCIGLQNEAIYQISRL